MKCNFRVGQKVVCVREHHPAIRREMAMFGVTTPVKGGVYTVRKIREVAGQLCLYLDEIVNPVIVYLLDGVVDEQGFAPDRFRPVTTRKTDISIFKAMLTPSKLGVSA